MEKHISFQKEILVVMPVEQHHKEKLEKAAPGGHFTYASSAEVTPDMVSHAQIILGNVPASYISANPDIEWIQLSSAGADEYIAPGILAPGTILTNATGAYGKAVAENAFAVMMMLQKQLHLYRDAQHRREWTDCGPVSSISDATVLIVGLGDIGLHFAGMAGALGAHTIGVKRRAGNCPENVDELYTIDCLDEQLPRADVIVSFLPANDGTYHLYTEKQFGLMKKTAIFINGGRGSAVDMDLLCDVLDTHQIAAAGIDVTETEPLPADHPLWQMPNLMLTPHIYGGFHLPETFEKIVDITADNLEAYICGRPLKNIVDFKTGCRE